MELYFSYLHHDTQLIENTENHLTRKANSTFIADLSYLPHSLPPTFDNFLLEGQYRL